MPYKNYQNKIRYNQIYNPNRVHTRNGGSIPKRINLNGIQNRTYVCIFCGEIFDTEFHHPIPDDDKFVFECCHDCHEFCDNQTFDDSKLFME